MINENIPVSRIYKTESDGACINCGKKNKELDRVFETTYVFEYCSLQKIFREIREYFEVVWDGDEIVKITIKMAEKPKGGK